MALAALLMTVSCDRNIEPYREGEVPRKPDLARIFPAPTEAAPMGDSGLVPPSPPASRGYVPESSATVSGTIRLADGVDAPSGAVLFLFARPAGVTAGPPLAARRIADPRFPLDFEIGPDDVMIPTMRFEGPISLGARLDADGSATTRDPSEPSATTAEPVTPGTSGVELTLR